MTAQFIIPNWPAPSHINAYTTLRYGGNSKTPYDDFNLAIHVGDEPADVITNRTHLTKLLNLPEEPIWIQQIHGNTVLEATDYNREKEADATFSRTNNKICAVLTADCLPILLCDREGTVVAAVHAGWKGLAKGIITETIKQLNRPADQILAWLGPGISAKCYPVGADIRETFLKINEANETAFTSTNNNQFLTDLYYIARVELAQAGVTAIFGGDRCTFTEKNQFFSYRRDGHATGRMATLIWI